MAGASPSSRSHGHPKSSIPPPRLPRSHSAGKDKEGAGSGGRGRLEWPLLRPRASRKALRGPERNNSGPRVSRANGVPARASLPCFPKFSREAGRAQKRGPGSEQGETGGTGQTRGRAQDVLPAPGHSFLPALPPRHPGPILSRPAGESPGPRLTWLVPSILPPCRQTSPHRQPSGQQLPSRRCPQRLSASLAPAPDTKAGTQPGPRARASNSRRRALTPSRRPLPSPAGCAALPPAAS